MFYCCVLVIVGICQHTYGQVNDLSLRTIAILTIGLLISALSAIFLSMIYAQGNEDISLRVQSDQKMVLGIVQNSIKQSEKIYIARIKGFTSANNNILKAMYDKDIEKLKKFANKRVAVLKNESAAFRNITFIDNEYNILTRTINDIRGDNVKHIPFIREAGENNKVVSGINITKGGVFYVLASPAYYKGKHAGIIVFVLNMNLFSNQIMNMANTEFGVFGYLKKMRKYAHSIEKKKHEDFTLIDSSNDKYMKKFCDKIIDMENSSLIEQDGKTLIYHKIPLKDYVGDNVANLIVITDISDQYKSFNKKMEKTILIAIVMLIICIVFIYYFFGRMLRKIELLNKSLEKKVADRTNELNELNLVLENSNKELEERVAKETETRMHKEQLLFQQSKFADMGKMVSVIAHQWRQPLNTLGLIIQDIEDAKMYNELTDDYLSETTGKGMEIIEHMSDTIDDFRNFFHTSEKSEVFCLTNEVQSIMNLFIARLTYNDISLVFKVHGKKHSVEELKEHEKFCNGNHYYVEGVLGEFKQVVLNLLSNAVEAVVETTEKELIIDIYDKDDKIYLTIEDTGGGVPYDIIDKIFDPYFTTKGDKSGTGIGLYVCKLVIDVHMLGKITVDNASKGAKFCIALPRQTEES